MKSIRGILLTMKRPHPVTTVLVTPASASPVCLDHDEGILNRGVFVKSDPPNSLCRGIKHTPSDCGACMIRSAGSHQSSLLYTPPLVCHFQEHENREGGQGVDDQLATILSSGLHPAHHTTEATPPLPGWSFSIARATSEVEPTSFAGWMHVSKQAGTHGSKEL
ncbi:hypothetical protein HDV64DRAFT_81695 [Trichoderma sp. TUCIM 5745]